MKPLTLQLTLEVYNTEHGKKKILILHTLKWQELTNETFMIEQVHRRIWIQGSVSRNPEWWREDLPALIRLTGTTQPEGVTLSAYTL